MNFNDSIQKCHYLLKYYLNIFFFKLKVLIYVIHILCYFKISMLDLRFYFLLLVKPAHEPQDLC